MREAVQTRPRKVNFEKDNDGPHLIMRSSNLDVSRSFPSSTLQQEVRYKHDTRSGLILKILECEVPKCEVIYLYTLLRVSLYSNLLRNVMGWFCKFRNMVFQNLFHILLLLQSFKGTFYLLGEAKFLNIKGSQNKVILNFLMSIVYKPP